MQRKTADVRLDAQLDTKQCGRKAWWYGAWCKAANRALTENRVQYRPMQSQIQSLDIKQLAERSSRVIASTILIDCPAITATATTIPSSYFVSTVSTDCSVSTVLDLPDAVLTAISASRSVPLFWLFCYYYINRLPLTVCRYWDFYY